jgi:hypothetical protein
MTERFTKAYNALVTAFFEGTLAKGTCVACACGNIIFDAIGDPVTKNDLCLDIVYSNNIGTQNPPRKRALTTELWAKKRSRDIGGFIAVGSFADEINEAGYTAAEFAKIETAFEYNTSINFTEYPALEEQDILEDQYKGLCAVVDVLLELDGEEIPKGNEFKQKFREHPKLVA